jgi:hypothetical protein
MNLTLADRRFEAFCRDRGLACRRIAEGPEPTPDYEVTGAVRPIAVEVKQIDPNASDHDMLARLRAGRTAARAVNTVRARNPIKEACGQLSAYTQGEFPGIVLLVDNSGFGLDYLEPTSLADCLFGLERLHFTVPHDPAVDSEVLGMSHGSHRIFTPHHNTSTSAVATLTVELSGERMAIFHNPFAKSPLKPDDLFGDAFVNYDWKPEKPDHIEVWQLRVA